MEDVGTDPVEVYCRVRPLKYADEERCAKKTDAEHVILYRSVDARTNVAAQHFETTYQFRHVFGENATQAEIFQRIGLPSVSELIAGKDSLLFAYGVTSSGKTHTISGPLADPGLLPRMLDTLFNSVGQYLAMPYVFLPNAQNGFQIVGEAEAMEIRQRLLSSAGEQTPQKLSSRAAGLARNGYDGTTGRYHEQAHVGHVNRDHNFAVFVSYVQIYNSNCYDLLHGVAKRELGEEKCALREDDRGRYYMSGAELVEIRSVDDALRMFHHGEQSRKVADTRLNSGSSRSHAVFSVRLVQVPLGDNGNDMLTDKRYMAVSQIDLVDLAGSERAKRTENVGHRLREAGQINKSLMGLRECFEVMRKIQNGEATKNTRVPYRNSTLTQLFKAYFEGKGHIRMILCINPASDEINELPQVMQFAEMSQEVLVRRGAPVADVIAASMQLATGRRDCAKELKAEREHLERRNKAEEDRRRRHAERHEKELRAAAANLYAPFPAQLLERANSDDDALEAFASFVQARMQQQNKWMAELYKSHEELRVQLRNRCLDNHSLRATIGQFRSELDARDRLIDDFEKRMAAARRMIHELKRDNAGHEQQERQLMQHVDECQEALAREKAKRQKFELKLRERARLFREEKDTEMKDGMLQAQSDLEQRLRQRDEQLMRVRDIIETGDSAASSSKPGTSHTASPARATLGPSLQSSPISVQQVPPRVQQHNADSDRAARLRRHEGGATVVNPRYNNKRRSQSAERWIDHRSKHVVPTGTVLQPHMPGKVKCVTQLKTSDFKPPAQYSLVHQEADTEGELETRIYHGNVIPTATGGTSVMLHDVEVLRQRDPESSARHKRKSDDVPNERLMLGLSPSEVKRRCQKQSPQPGPSHTTPSK